MRSAAVAMADTIVHRGPDDGGIWTNVEDGVAFGFRRLAIIDLSTHGHQPMRSRSERFTIVFNGEVFNHEELSQELRALGHAFRGHSDTEVILAAFEQWGVEAAVTRFIGMFAIAAWDGEESCLYLIRDRLGIKPLHVYHRAGTVAFASELKSIRALPDFKAEIDTDSLASFFRYLYVPAPRSIYRCVYKLLPGHLLRIDNPGVALPESRPYWSLEDASSRGLRAPFEGAEHEAVDALEAALRDAVRLRMRSDVPIGAFLSGGVDSATVVSLMQEISERPVRTFTIGFDVGEHDESEEASAVARHLGTDHNTLRLDGKSALDLIPLLPDTFDEPLADPSQLPTYLICRSAREEVTVALSGDGGDELFAGYNRYLYGSRMIPRAARLPLVSRKLIASGLRSVRPATWDRLSRGFSSLSGSGLRLAGEKAHKLAKLLENRDSAEMYSSLVSAWQNPPIAGSSGLEERSTSVLKDDSLSILERMMLADQGAYLADDLLAKVDRASMAVSLEVRVPILDHRVVELSWRLPERLKLRDGQSKWILRQVLERRVPRELMDRPKVGFSVPLSQWLRGPLRPWAEDLLSSRNLSRTAELDVQAIRELWAGFLARDHNDHLAIWTVLVYQSWYNRWMS